MNTITERHDERTIETSYSSCFFFFLCFFFFFSFFFFLLTWSESEVPPDVVSLSLLLSLRPISFAVNLLFPLENKYKITSSWRKLHHVAKKCLRLASCKHNWRFREIHHATNNFGCLHHVNSNGDSDDYIMLQKSQCR